jgi:hypothetical protein
VLSRDLTVPVPGVHVMTKMTSFCFYVNLCRAKRCDCVARNEIRSDAKESLSPLWSRIAIKVKGRVRSLTWSKAARSNHFDSSGRCQSLRVRLVRLQDLTRCSD